MTRGEKPLWIGPERAESFCALPSEKTVAKLSHMISEAQGHSLTLIAGEIYTRRA
jgi:hypothetical protein